MIDFLTTEFLRSDLVALGSLCVAALTALYAKRQAAEARRANEIAIREARRPARLAVYQSMVEFASFCASYYTGYCIGAVTGSRDLVSKISAFKWAVEQQGHLSMPPVEALVADLERKAWLLQREIDRIDQRSVQVNDPKLVRLPPDRKELEALVDWFGAQRENVRKAFEPFLSEA